MIKKEIDVFYSFLRQNNVRVTKSKVEDFLLSHPDYGSFVAFADLCNELKIEYIALETSVENFTKNNCSSIIQVYDELGLEFIQIDHVNFETCQICYLKKEKKLFYSFEEFKKKWTGYVFYVIPNNLSGEEKYSLKRTYELLSFSKYPILVFSIIPIVGYYLYVFLISPFSPFVSLFLIKCFGFFVCVNLVSHTLGGISQMSETLCKQSAITNCEDVLNSPASKLFGLISLSDIGLIYFGGSLFILILSLSFNMQNKIIFVLFLISISSIPFIIFSLYYQMFKIKKLCPFCLLVIFTLFIECFFVAIFYKKIGYYVFSFKEIGFVCLSFVFVTSLWYVLKNLIVKSKEGINSKYDFLRLKKKPHIFNAFFQNARSYNMEYSENDIILGDVNSTITITTVINTHCALCAQVHERIRKNISAYSNLVKLNIRFTLGLNNEDLTLYLIEIYHLEGAAIFEQALDFWFKTKNYELLKHKYPVDRITAASSDVLLKHISWVYNNLVTATPTIFLNDKKIEKEYVIEDIKWLIHNIISK